MTDELADLKRLLDELLREIRRHQAELANASELDRSVQEVQHALRDPNPPKASLLRAVLTGIVDGAGKVSTVAGAAIKARAALDGLL